MTIRPKLLAATAVALLASVTTAQAALTNGFTVGSGYTEGFKNNRATVAGTTDIDVDVPGATAYDLGALDPNEIIGIYGRIVQATDTFSFRFDARGAFEIAFDFDGYDLKNGGSVAAGESGFVTQSDVGLVGSGDATNGGKGAMFSLLRDGTVIASRSLLTNTTSATAADPLLFGSSGPGLYTLVVDGSVGPKRNTAALYDLAISSIPSPIPVPAALPLLAAGLAGLGLAGRRQRKAG